MLRILFCLTLAVTLLNACTIEKRTFRKGWHVEWKQHHESVAAASEKETPAAAIRPSEAAVRDADLSAKALPEPKQEMAAEGNGTPVQTAGTSRVADDAAQVQDRIPVAESIAAAEKPLQEQVRHHSFRSEDGRAPVGPGLWWVVALLVGIALASTIWLAVGTGGSAGLLIALFVALFSSVVGAIMLSIRIKKDNPKEPEEDIQFDDLTEAEIQRRKKLKGLIAVLVLLAGGVVIIVVGSK